MLVAPDLDKKKLSMSLHIGQRESGRIVIVDLKGPLTFGHGDLEVRDRLPSLHQSGKVNIALNLKDVSDIDSTGLGDAGIWTRQVAQGRRKAGGGRMR
jgi:hypothetical protein